MLNVLKNKDDYIVAYVEWNRVNQLGQVVKDGLFLNIRYLWIHKKYEGKGAMGKLIYLIDNDLASFGSEYLYWFRRKYTKRQTPNLSRKRLAKMGVKNDGYI